MNIVQSLHELSEVETRNGLAEILKSDEVEQLATSNQLKHDESYLLFLSVRLYLFRVHSGLNEVDDVSMLHHLVDLDLLLEIFSSFSSEFRVGQIKYLDSVFIALCICA